MFRLPTRHLPIPEPANDLPTIHESAVAQIDLWHAFGSNVFLQRLLRKYDLDYSSANVGDYDRFKIGINESRHEATFAIDATHYVSFAMDKFNVKPLDKSEASRVLEYICRLRDGG